MTRILKAGARRGSVYVPSSKSAAHRMLICAALSKHGCELRSDGLSDDILATAQCLAELCAKVEFVPDGRILTRPQEKRAAGLRVLPCAESGSTLRFLLPLAGALGVPCVFRREGRLAERPLDALMHALTSHGMSISSKGAELYCSGALSAGEYEITGSISSQYISGLLFALPLLKGESTLRVSGKIESASYRAMTEDCLRKSGIRFEKQANTYRIPGGQTYDAPERARVERDWSGAAFFVCMGAFSDGGICVRDMNLSSCQGDRAVIDIVRRFGAQVTFSGNDVTVKRGDLHGTDIDASDIPDLVPALSVLAAGAHGVTRITNAGRLRFKESDRLKTVSGMLRALGSDVSELPDGLIIRGSGHLEGGSVCAANDHRIAMAAAEGACVCANAVLLDDGKCVRKSYPAFWSDYESLEEDI